MATTVSGLSEAHNPLPDFVFPAKATPSSSAPSSFSRSTGNRRPVSVAELPSFTFNPSGAINPDSGIASPPLSPNRPIPSRSGYHKRGTSEFIGGDGKSGSGLGLMSTSPTKGDGTLPSPTPISTLGPGPGRRGHQHRRSAAISAHDLSFILKPTDPNAIPRGGSAPCSPSGDEHKHSPFPGIEQLASKDKKQDSPEDSPPMKPSNRARVGFSDDIQFIPRPLSLVSSESSGTTARPGGHSVSGSLSSIISASSPPPKDQHRSPKSVDARPKTAAARLDGSRTMSPTPDAPSPRRHRSNPLLADLASGTTPASPSTPKFPSKKWAFFGHEDCSPTSRPTSAASSKELQIQTSEPSSPTKLNPDILMTSTEVSPSRNSSVSRKTVKKKQKKVKSWAGSILSRKSRQRSQKQSRRSPTPPLRSYGQMNENPSIDFIDQNIYSSSAPKSEVTTDFSSWVPRRVQTQDDESSLSPIIDLDAALGPFNTPSGRDAEWDAVTGGNGITKRGKRMHSAAGMGNFGGPGMHYHRRAQSSPEFENPRFSIRHLNSSSTMADVFEEDEEEEGWEDAKASSDKESFSKTEDDDDEVSIGIDIKVVDAEDMHIDKAMDWTLDNGSTSMRGVKRKGSGLSEGDRRHLGTSMKSATSSTSLQEDTIVEESPSPVEVVNDSRPDSRAQSSDSTANPPFRARTGKDLAPVDIQPFTLQPPYLTPTSPHSTVQSSFPSPRSPFSYDTQRISTAPSSITDEGGFQSLLLGEPGPELRMSVDDVPSLTSSNSTMTSGVLPMGHNPQFRDGQRSASLSSAAITRKRSSIASLSRLISSSHGEKSKLSIESRAPTFDTDKKEKGSKSKRISRMMQFWKPKEST